MNNLKESVQESIKWTAIVAGINTAIQPFYRILLAVLLLPTEFSYIAVITLIVSFAEILNNIGIGQALVQKDYVNSQDLSTLFIFNIVVTLVIASILFFNTGVIESFYKMPGLSKIIELITLIILFNGITSIFKFYLHRNLLFKETSIVKMIKNITEIIVAIVLILIGLNIWGYVIGVIFANLLNAVLLTVLVFKKTNIHIKIYFSFKTLKDYLNFGVYVSMNRIATFFNERIDEIIIGGILPSEVLGIYFLAKNTLIQVQSLITTSFGQVLLPTFSKLKYNFKKQKELYLKMISLLMFVGTPIFMLIIFTADIFVPIIFGEQWTESAKIFQLLSLPVFSLLLTSFLTSSLLYSQGRTITVLLIEVILGIIYIISLSVLHQENLNNIIIIFSLYLIMKFFINQLIISNIWNIRVVEYLKIIKGPIGSGLLTSLILSIVVVFRGHIIEILFLSLIIFMGGILYLLFNFLINKHDTKRYFNQIFEIIKK